MKINDIPIYMLKALVTTILLELVLALILGIRSKKDILNIILVNVMTNPIVVSVSIAILFYFGLKIRNISLIFLELFAVLSEGFIYKNLEYKKINPFILSLILNACSFFIGLLI